MTGRIGVARAVELHAPDRLSRPLAGAEVHAPLRQARCRARGRCRSDRTWRRAPSPPVRASRDRGRRARRSARAACIACRCSRSRAFASGPMLNPSDDEKLADARAGKMLRAFELHVLDEMRQPLLVVVFEHRSRFDDEPQLGAARRPAVRADVVAQAVRQRADGRFGIHRHQLRSAVYEATDAADVSRPAGRSGRTRSRSARREGLRDEGSVAKSPTYANRTQSRVTSHQSPVRR